MINLKKYYAWVGQQATCGTPHPRTGQFSLAGDIKVFSTKPERDEFVAEYRSDNQTMRCMPCSYRRLKQINAGLTMSEFDRLLGTINLSIYNH